MNHRTAGMSRVDRCCALFHSLARRTPWGYRAQLRQICVSNLRPCYLQSMQHDTQLLAVCLWRHCNGLIDFTTGGRQAGSATFPSAFTAVQAAALVRAAEMYDALPQDTDSESCSVSGISIPDTVPEPVAAAPALPAHFEGCLLTCNHIFGFDILIAYAPHSSHEARKELGTFEMPPFCLSAALGPNMVKFFLRFCFLFMSYGHRLRDLKSFQ